MFKVGQTVWCILFGKGEVVSINKQHSSDDHPVEVLFLNGEERYYTEEGRCSPNSNRCLFFSNPVIRAETEPPFVPTMVGKRFVANSKSNRDTLFVVEVVSETMYDIKTSKGTFYSKNVYDFYEVSNSPVNP